MDDDHPVYVGHYLRDLGPEGGQGVLRLFIDLSLNFAPHEIILRITIFLAGRPDFLGPVVLQPSASPGGFWLCLGWQGHKIHCPREAKSPFCVNFGQQWHLPPQYPGFGTKLSLKGKPRTCALLETFQSPVDLFSVRKAFLTAAGVLYSAYKFLYLMMVCYIT